MQLKVKAVRLVETFISFSTFALYSFLTAYFRGLNSLYTTWCGLLTSSSVYILRGVDCLHHHAFLMFCQDNQKRKLLRFEFTPFYQTNKHLPIKQTNKN